MTPTFFATPDEFRTWLARHHDTTTELLVGFYKVGSGKPSMTWPESVDQALCFGWIDGVRKSVDQDSYCIRFTPRKPTSIWSTVNIQKVEALSRAELMTPAGQRAFDRRSEEKSSIYAYEKAPVWLDTDSENQFRANPSAWEFFMKQAPSYRNTIVHWIMGAKQEKTRLARLEKTISASEQQQRLR